MYIVPTMLNVSVVFVFVLMLMFVCVSLKILQNIVRRVVVPVVHVVAVFVK